jgi:hypothetical protein
LSVEICSSNNSFTFFSIFSFFLLISDKLPLHCVSALESSFNPSKAKKVFREGFSKLHTK